MLFLKHYFFIEIGPDPDTFKMIKRRRLMTNAAEVLHSLRFTNRYLHCDSLTLTLGGECGVALCVPRSFAQAGDLQKRVRMRIEEKLQLFRMPQVI